MLLQRRLTALVREAPGPVALTVLLALAASAASVGQWLCTAIAIRRVIEGGEFAGITTQLIGIGVLVTLRSGLVFLRDLAATRTAEVVKLRMRDRLYAKLTDVGPGYSVTRQTGDLQATTADGVEALTAYVGFYLPQAGVAILTPLLLVGVMVAIDVWVGAITGLCVVVVVVARPLWRKLLGDRARAHWDAYARFAARIHDAMAGMSTLKMLGASERHGEALAADAGDLYRATVRNLMAGMGVYSVITLVMGLGTAVATAVGAFRFAGGHIDLAGLLLVLFLSAECFRPLLELQNYWHEGFTGIAASNGIFALLDAEELVHEPADPTPVPTFQGRSPAVSFDDVRFAYPGTDRPALDGVSLHVDGGRTLAVVGRSGAGKSTLVALLLRFFDPQSGALRVDGIDVRDLSLADARGLVSVVSQDTYLFGATVADNLRLAKPSASDDELVQAAQRAGAHEFIVTMRDGYDTVLGERGATLSGGERQRVAIARALLRDAPVLVLDEATSSVDARVEAAVQVALAELSAGRTTIVIAHRLSTVASADVVAVLDEGRVVESGPPAELLARGGEWARHVAAHAAAS